MNLLIYKLCRTVIDGRGLTVTDEKLCSLGFGRFTSTSLDYSSVLTTTERNKKETELVA